MSGGKIKKAGASPISANVSGQEENFRVMWKWGPEGRGKPGSYIYSKGTVFINTYGRE
jgi:hypothetical protein